MKGLELFRLLSNGCRPAQTILQDIPVRRLPSDLPWSYNRSELSVLGDQKNWLINGFYALHFPGKKPTCASPFMRVPASLARVNRCEKQVNTEAINRKRKVAVFFMDQSYKNSFDGKTYLRRLASHHEKNPLMRINSVARPTSGTTRI